MVILLNITLQRLIDAASLGPNGVLRPTLAYCVSFGGGAVCVAPGMHGVRLARSKQHLGGDYEPDLDGYLPKYFSCRMEDSDDPACRYCCFFQHLGQTLMDDFPATPTHPHRALTLINSPKPREAGWIVYWSDVGNCISFLAREGSACLSELGW